MKQEKELEVIQLKKTIKGLKEQVDGVTKEIRMIESLKVPSKLKSGEEDFTVIEKKIVEIANCFKADLNTSEFTGAINETNAKNKENLLKYLSSIEKLVITYITDVNNIKEKEILKKRVRKNKFSSLFFFYLILAYFY
jgi:hypothetical protein